VLERDVQMWHKEQPHEKLVEDFNLLHRMHAFALQNRSKRGRKGQATFELSWVFSLEDSELIMSDGIWN
jgi:hypothetical protein